MNLKMKYQKSSFLPVTITGVIALERSLMGLLTILNGRPWWKVFLGAIRLDEIKSFKSINTKLLETDDRIKKHTR